MTDWAAQHAQFIHQRYIFIFLTDAFIQSDTQIALMESTAQDQGPDVQIVFCVLCFCGQDQGMVCVHPFLSRFLLRNFPDCEARHPESWGCSPRWHRGLKLTSNWLTGGPWVTIIDPVACHGACSLAEQWLPPSLVLPLKRRETRGANLKRIGCLIPTN